MRTLLSSVLCTLLFTISQAQSVRPPLSAAPLFPNAYSLKETDAFSFLVNPAALANTALLTGGIYGERRFLLQELAFYQVALCVPTNSGQLGFGGGYMGSITHSEGRAGLAYGRKLGSKVDVGARFNYQLIKIAGYGSASAVYVDAGALLHLSELVHLGLHISNPTSARLGKEGEDLLPVGGTAGVGYEVSPQFFMATEVQKILHQELSVNAAVQYRFDERLWGRVGFRSATSTYYFGLGVALKALKLEATASVHPQLGVTPGLQLIFTAKVKEQ
ncbi:MAG TPA: hypothetical protein VGE66_00615 [Chitinophagaceae bacterium]